MTTAKLAIRNKEWAKAETNLEKEIQNNPSNVEAYIMLAEVKMQNGDLMGAALTINRADPHHKDLQLKIKAEQFKGTLWRLAYNFGVDLFNKYFSTKKTSFLDSSIKTFRAGTTVRPQVPDFYPLIAQAYETKGDIDEAVKYYELYGQVVQKELDFAKETGVYIKIPRANALQKLGKPEYSRGLRYSPGSDSIIIDKFMVGNKEVFIFSNDKEKVFEVFGWRVEPPKEWLSDEKEQPTEMNSVPFAALAQIYFNKKDYDKSIQNVQKILILEPENSDVNSFLVSVYDAQGKRDEAAKFIESLVAKDPNNKMYRAQYGDILLQLGEYDKAIAQYEQALKVDPNFDFALRNCAAAYKNKVALIQKKQIDAGKNEPQEYIGDLEKSIEYFEKSRKTPRFMNDYEVLGELAQLYFVNNKIDKVKEMAAELEALDPLIKQEDKEKYLYVLLKVYDSYLKNEKKMKEIQEKINSLNNK